MPISSDPADPHWPLPRDQAEFGPWQARVVAAVRAIAGVPPGPVAAAMLSTRADGELTRAEHELRADGHQPLRVVTCYRTTGGPMPAVVVCPGRNAVVDQVTGAQPPDYPDRNVAEQLARAGFLTATIDYGLDGQLDPGLLAGRDEAAVLAQLLAISGRSLLGVLAGGALATADWLATHHAAAPGQVALFGHSLGGAVALHAGLLSGRALPVCVASHLGSYQVIGYGHPAGALPGIGSHADLPGLLGALAPAPLQLQYGTADPTLDPADAAAAGRLVRDLYAIAGARGRAEVVTAEMGHGTQVAAAIDFLRRAPSRREEAFVPGLRVGFDPRMRGQVAGLVEQTLAAGTLTDGPLLARFEQGIGELAGQPVVAVDSGSSALEIALRDIGVAGRIVLTPVNTFIATASAAIRAGASVDFVDLEPDGLGLSPDSLRERLGRHGEAVAAVIAMHTGGIVAPALDQVIKECHPLGIPVIEDAAHALGSALGGRRAGTIADYGAYSFYPTKVLTTGEGGAVTAPQEAALASFRRMRDHGRTARGATTHDCLGSNWRLSELHAAVGLAQLAAFAARTSARQRLAGRYREALAGLPGLRLQALPAGSVTSWYKFIAHLPDGTDRQALKTRLRDRGVGLAGEVYDILLCDQPYFAGEWAGRWAGGGADRDFPHARRFAAAHICLPLYPELTDAEQDRVIAALYEELC